MSATVSHPLSEPAPWIFKRSAEVSQQVAVVAKSWFEARQRAPIAFYEEWGERADEPVLVCNPVHHPEEARRIAEELKRHPVRIKLRADCVEVAHVLSLDEVREALAEGRREAAPLPLQGLRVNGSAVPWGDGFYPREPS